MKLFLYFFQYSMSCLTLFTLYAQEDSHHIKHIIWDAGSTLTTIDHWGIAGEMGAKNIAQMLWHIGGQKAMRRYMKESLEQYAGKQRKPRKNDIFSNDDRGLPLPHFMSDTWLCSRIPNKELIEHIDNAVDKWKPKKSVTPTQRRLVKKVLKTALSAEILGNHTYCPEKAINIVKKLFEKGYTQYILSNFDKESFDIAYKNNINTEIMGYIPKENIVISGECGLIKPYRCMFTYFLEKYQLKPEECLLIDDQLENIKVARSLGMQAIQIKNAHYRRLERKLKKLTIL